MVFRFLLQCLCLLLLSHSMTRKEATAIAYGDRDLIVEILLQLSARIEELERKVALLTKDSSNSSKPPSSDGPASKPRPRPPIKSRKRKPGGQPGHKGKTRQLLPLEEVDEVIDVFPSACEICHGPVGPHRQGCAAACSPERRQVTDIPPITPVVTEYRLHSITCSCGAVTKAAAPPAARWAFGPRIQGFAAYLTACHKISRRGLQEIFTTLFGVSICLGSVCNHLEEMTRSLEHCCDGVRNTLAKEPVLNVDETGWKTKGVSRWLWVFVTPMIAYFLVAKSRGSKVLREILGETFSGVLCSDMLGSYKAFHKGVRQFCWAHIIRALKGLKHTCRSPDAVEFSKWMLSQIGRLFRLRHAFRNELIDRKTLIKKAMPTLADMMYCLRRYQDSSDREVARTAKSLLKNWDGLFTFLLYEGVEPTNNSAERGVRPGVQWRKNCYGNQSEEGELLTSRLLTVTRTCILQERNPLDFLVDSIIAYRSRSIPPSLLSATL
jgi:transposase